MAATLLIAIALTVAVGASTISFTTGPGSRAWWQNPLVIIALSVLLGVLVILKRQGRRGIPIASVFTLLMSALLLWFVFITGPIEL